MKFFAKLAAAPASLWKSFMPAVLGAALLAGCASYRAEHFMEGAIEGRSALPALARAYQSGAREHAEHGDWGTAAYYAEKGLTALEGERPEPVDYSELALVEEDIYPLFVGRRYVIDATAKSENPEACGLAQRAYDDWAINSSANKFSYDGSYLGGRGGAVMPHWVEDSRTLFFDSMQACAPRAYARMRTEMEGRSGSRIASVISIPLGDKIAERTIYFAFDSSRMDELGLDILRGLVDMRSQYDRLIFNIIGHADTSGPRWYNQQLGGRRADMVAEELRNMGMRSVQTSSRGESEPAVQTGDGVREPLNRRAEIGIYTPE